MRTMVWFFILLTAVMITSGCSVLNPYRSDFTCPQKENGKCVSVDAAYDESLKQGKKSQESTGIIEPPAGDKGATEAPVTKSELLYREEVNRKLAGLLREPVAPLVAPSQVVRVLVLPYRGEGGELFMSRYVYFFAEEPQWIVGDYLQEGTED